MAVKLHLTGNEQIGAAECGCKTDNTTKDPMRVTCERCRNTTNYRVARFLVANRAEQKRNRKAYINATA